ncbi:hypothetical protein QJS10_CPA03g01374 [Acorus calamus]|uniref:RING-type domain-containing protein n=1 Tax=Acorus calamus TaxID=4465 RepID=A0AAV9F8N8_ACOCL|nr:hypothetical protein QJS10_CPA03g01373 [Acorus calamus]KAK1321477.1 hypothetical protein QJS10_CPA03g01374 [Acorus calamus]
MSILRFARLRNNNLRPPIEGSVWESRERERPPVDVEMAISRAVLEQLQILEQIHQSSDWVEPRGRGPPPASEAAVESLPEVEVEVELVCAVCLEGMRAGEKARRMPCDHMYHGHCIST